MQSVPFRGVLQQRKRKLKEREGRLKRAREEEEDLSEDGDGNSGTSLEDGADRGRPSSDGDDSAADDGKEDLRATEQTALALI